ncbi:MAG TPA: lysophospholipid acyltransferase family protein [Candidatus Binatia bacterium]|nr:lysophospholipid acyltransferase family protein [Candidatus Binatia bacterium]
MIRAEKTGPAAWLVERYVQRKTRRAFRGLWVRGELPPRDASLVLYANHSNFWDGFIGSTLCHAAGWDGYCMMEEQQLARYRFLRRLGAFSVRRGDPHSAVETLRYARGLLTRPGTAVILFPEGVLRPSTGVVHPLERGIEVLARSAGVRCLPVGIRYRFFEHELPDVVLAIGAAHEATTLDDVARRLDAVLGELSDARPLSDFRPLVRGARSVMDRWDAVRGMGGQG